MLAVTGTNGKTSTAWWLAQALGGARAGAAAWSARSASESRRRRGGASRRLQVTGLTTPDPVTLQTALRDFADQGFAACAIEASSIGLASIAWPARAIEVALFTNFTPRPPRLPRQHARPTGQAKAALFDWPGLQAAVVNIDDAQGAALAEQPGGAAARPLDLLAARRRPAARRTRLSRYVDGGLCLRRARGRRSALPVRTALIGDYNVANLLGVIGGLRALGVPLADAVRGVRRLTPVPGRMQRVACSPAACPEVVVDYAHTPDALEKALRRAAAVGRAARRRGCGACSAAAATATRASAR